MLALSHQCECWGTKIISITEEFLSRNRRIVFSLSQCFVDRDDFFQYDFIIEISVNFECLEACMSYRQLFLQYDNYEWLSKSS